MSTIQNEIDRIKESVADAYETVELMGGDVPSPDLQKIDTLSDSIATIKGGFGSGGSENILLNWDFRNPVNRSGSTTYSLTTTRCTVDSWYSENGCAVNVVDGGVTFDPKNDATCVFGQNVKEWELMKGKTVTFSALVSNVSAVGLSLWIYGVEGPVALPAIEVGNDVALYSITGTVDNGASSLRCGIQAVSSTATIKMIAAKLEYGSKQTLAKQNSDNVWEILDPPNYDLQYILCSQYDAVTSAWIGPQDKITGTTAQTAGFDANGNLAAVASAPLADAIVSDSRILDLDMNDAPRGKIVNYLYNNNVDQASYHSPMGELYGTTGETWYVVETFGVSNRVVQTAAAPYNHQRKFFIRFKHDTAWSPWREIASLSDIPIVSNPNLLLNWDFRNPVNRKGKTEYGNGEYSIDSWRNNGSIKMTLVEEQIDLLFNGEYSMIESVGIALQSLAGKKITLSVLYANKTGQVYSTFIINNNPVGYGNFPAVSGWSVSTLTYTLPENLFGKIYVRIVGMTGDTVSIKAVKLELGSTQTLAKKNASGEWEIIGPPNYDLQYLLTSQYSPINGAYVGIQHSNPNLLDNWYFADPINQRGQTEYTKTGYTIDRWKNTGAYSEIALTLNGLHITSSNTYGFIFDQKIESFDFLDGKTVTLSVLVSEYVKGTLTVQHGWFKSDAQSAGLITATGVYNKSHEYAFRLYNTNDSDFTILAVKLELGPVQTLAHKEGDIWVLNDPPPNKQEELAKCQRYLQVYGRGFNDIGSIAFVQTDSNQTGKLNVNANLPQRMRANPVLTGLDSLQLRLSTEGGALTGTTTFTPSASVDSAGFIVENENIISGKQYTVGTNTFGKRLVISAEL